ncbi:MAG TPA: hypothetical protein EYP19_15855 [Desulfobacterales bacterium]|nr:hypothetical protein [Desulfobacterales bacterium]
MPNLRDSFLQLLNGERSERIVWTADIHYWISGQEFAGRTPPDWKREEGYLRLCRTLKIMPYYWYDKFWLGEPEYDKTVHVATEKHGYTTKRIWSTPVGELCEELAFMQESCSTAHTRYAVSTREDLDVLRYLIEHRSLRPTGMDDYPERLVLWRQFDGIPAIGMPRSPLSAFFYEWAGVEHGVFLLMDFPEVVQEVFWLLEEQEEPVLDAVCALAPPVVHFADNLSSDNMAGLYDTYMASGHKKRIERFHDVGTKCAVHLDGVVRGLLPKLASVGFDAIEALTPQPGGDLPVEKMREAAQNDSVVLWGGVPGVLFAPPYTWEDMEKHVYEVLEAWSGTRFILGVADQIPPDGNIQFCPRISDLVENWSNTILT